MFKLTVIVMLIVTSLSPAAIRADALSTYRIVDQLGLTRAFKRGKDLQTIEVTLNGHLETPIQLENVDGLASTIEAVVNKEGVVIIRDIRPGTWSIKLPSGEITIERVRFP